MQGKIYYHIKCGKEVSKLKDIDYGNVRINLESIIKAKDISINKLACRTEMQRTQLKKYIHNEVTRVDLSILARLCQVLECDIDDILEYEKPQNNQNDN